VPAKANRCPHCWAALAYDVGDFCPHCRRSLAVKQKRRFGEAPEEPKPVTRPAAPRYFGEPLGSFREPASTFREAEPAPTGGGVALAERDPVEFPGTPLPPGFFDALPEKTRPAKTRRFSLKTIGVGGVIAFASIGGISGIRQAAERDDALASPARHLVAGPCAEYRDFNDRLRKDATNQAALMQGLDWFQANADRFAAAAQLDPGLAKASEIITWYDNAIKDNFAPFATKTQDEFKAFEKPLAEACYNGPGRA